MIPQSVKIFIPFLRPDDICTLLRQITLVDYEMDCYTVLVDFGSQSGREKGTLYFENIEHHTSTLND